MAHTFSVKSVGVDHIYTSMQEELQEAELTALLRSMAADHIITIIVGEGEAAMTLAVQQSLLVNLSSFFTKALEHRHLGPEEPPNTLRFPADRVDVWKIFIYWVYKQRLPHTMLGSDDMLAVRCWILGDKYDIPNFQNDVMLFLIHIFECRHLDRDVLEEVVKNTAPEAPLRLFMAEEAVTSIKRDCGVRMRDLKDLEGSGFLGHFFDATERWEDCEDEDVKDVNANERSFSAWKGTRRLCTADREVSNGLGRYMVSKRPMDSAE